MKLRIFGYPGALILGLGLAAAMAQEAPPGAPAGPRAQTQRGQTPDTPRPAAAEGLRPLPADAVTKHKITLAGVVRDFTATAGTIRLSDAQTGAAQADIAYIAFKMDAEEARARPVTFAMNGGPGYASGWLNLGALGPWRLPMDGAAASPSAPPAVSDNPDSWLAFTDLVFLDPAGTGYSRILGNDDVRKSFWSVNGDINSLAVTIRRWVEANGRGVSPKFIAGESYGGFRAPKIARILQTDQGVGVDGLILISPVLDFRRFDAGGSLFNDVARLPAYAATLRERKGPITRDSLKDAEDYAAGGYLADVVKGINDKEAKARLTQRVSELTGLRPVIVERYAGRVPANVFAREINRAEGRVSSLYDTNVTGLNSNPYSQQNFGDDQLLNGLHAPISAAMTDLYKQKLNWNVENGRYLFRNDQAGRQWEGRAGAEAVSDLRRDLALDPRFRVLITHGLTDIVTPYFESKMVLDQIPDFGAPERLKLAVYPGGHMTYIREASRKAMRDDARRLVEGR